MHQYTFDIPEGLECHKPIKFSLFYEQLHYILQFGLKSAVMEMEVMSLHNRALPEDWEDHLTRCDQEMTRIPHHVQGLTNISDPILRGPGHHLQPTGTSSGLFLVRCKSVRIQSKRQVGLSLSPNHF